MSAAAPRALRHTPGCAPYLPAQQLHGCSWHCCGTSAAVADGCTGDAQLVSQASGLAAVWPVNFLGLFQDLSVVWAAKASEGARCPDL